MMGKRSELWKFTCGAGGRGETRIRREGGDEPPGKRVCGSHGEWWEATGGSGRKANLLRGSQGGGGIDLPVEVR